MRRPSHSSYRVVIAVSLFSLAGVALLLATRAAPTFLSSFEPESGALSGNVQTASDPNASDGGYVTFFAPPPTGGPVTLPNPGSWSNVTGTLAGTASECGNLTLLSAVPSSGTILAGVAQRGIWSNTSGTSWTHLGSGTGSASIVNRPTTISYDPAHPGTWYEFGIYGGGGAFKTTDYGVTWQQLGNVSHVDFGSVDYTDPNRQTIVAGHHENSPQTVWLSKNGGQTWTNIGTNLPAGTGFSSAPIVINATTYVVNTAPSWSGGSAGIYRTTNSGANWTRVSTVTTMPAAPLVTSTGAMFYQVGQYVSDHLVRSTDGGQTWTEVGSGLTGVTPIELSDGRIVSANSSRLMISSDAGATWTAFGANTPFAPLSLAYSSANKAFYISKWDCGNSVLPDAIQKLQ